MPPIGHMDWIGFRKLDPRPTLAYTTWYHNYLHRRASV